MTTSVFDDISTYWTNKVDSEAEKAKNEHVNLTDNIQEKTEFSKKEMSKMYKNIARHHIDAFDFAMSTWLDRAWKYMLPFEYTVPDEHEKVGFKKMTVWYESFEIGKPTHEDIELENPEIYPSECRQRKMTYAAPLFANISRKFDDEMNDSLRVKLGEIPVMIGSKFCNLKGLNEKQLVQKGEDMSEFGGYFMVNGNEKVIRMLIVPKRNFPVVFTRSKFVNRGKDFTAYACQMRCVRDDLTAQTITLHYLSDGSISLRFLYQKQEFLVPIILILKAFKNCTDREIYEKIVKGNYSQKQITDRVEAILMQGKELNIYNSDQSKAMIGSRFRVVLSGVTEEMSDIEVGDLFLTKYICIHTDDYEAKFNTICLMINKLYAAVADETELDNLDSVAFHDVLLGGHLYLQILAEKLFDTLHINLRARINKDIKKDNFDAIKFREINTTTRLIESSGIIGKRMENFLATGNLISRTNLDLMQTTGFSIIADKLNNIRYLSHFRSIHRGQYFAEQKTTSVRKLLPESWGFLCPVHTPDGAPCGLLNHISMSWVPIGSEESQVDLNKLKKVLGELGMNSITSDLSLNYDFSYYPVMYDGIHLGYVSKDLGDSFVKSLRYLKCSQSKPEYNIPRTLEIAYIPFSGFERNLQWPGIFLHTTPARFTRPVKNIEFDCIEWISPLEQMNLSIACLEDDIIPESTHQELDPINILSIIASVGVFAEYNQSPRNMYQWQMAKQTMGTPYHNHPFRTDNKVYRILFPQRPIVKTRTQVDYDMEEYPSGANAVVAVLSYTGYDIEDAMIINKSSYERGFGHGSVYKSYTHDLNETASLNVRGVKSNVRYKLLNNVGKREKSRIKLNNVDSDGLPKVGSLLTKGKPELCVFDTLNSRTKNVKFKDSEKARVETIRVSGNDNSHPDNVSLNYTIRYSRNPVIGDKFSSRHGQKGVLSVLWPQIDMPFTENGITPDLIINPHAFPSRMTMGMLIESMAAKSGSLRGEYKTVETFQKFEGDDIADHFGQELLKNGYNYYGNEVMYSGIYGTPLKVDIFIGVVYYQRLRHMVSDKSQARATGPIDILTHQPVKGRKKGGGIRFGEMERDSMLAHGAAFWLNDRLFRSSDYSEGFVCQKCGSILSWYVNRAIMKNQSFIPPNIEKQDKKEEDDLEGENDEEEDIHMNERAIWKVCKKDGIWKKVSLPFVLRFMTNELASMGIKLQYSVKDF